jgi:hypothetical protein
MTTFASVARLDRRRRGSRRRRQVDRLLLTVLLAAWSAALTRASRAPEQPTVSVVVVGAAAASGTAVRTGRPAWPATELLARLPRLGALAEGRGGVLPPARLLPLCGDGARR